MPGLVPGIDVLFDPIKAGTWTAGKSPAMKDGNQGRL
jgi:hypothetical protein